MEHLKDIIKIIKKKRIDKIDLIDNDLISSEDSLMSRLYTGLRDEKFSTDSEALIHLYGEESEKNQQNFRRLKSRLARRIFNTLYFLDMNLYSVKDQYERIAYEQRKIVSTLHILKRNGAREAAIKVIKDNYHTAEKHYLYDVLKVYDYELSIYYSLSGDPSNFKKYSERYYVHNDYENLVQQSTITYYGLQLEMHYKKGVTKTNHTEKLRQLDQHLKILGDIRAKVYSYETEYYYLRASLTYYEQKCDAISTLNVSEDIIQLTTQSTFRQEIWLGVAVLYKSKALLSLKKYDEGQKLLNDNKTLFNEGGINWFTLKEFTFLMALQAGQMGSAAQIIKEIFQHKSFKTKPDYLVQKWHILKAYFNLMEDETSGNPHKSTLKIARLFNDAQYYVNDKSGYFLAIRFLELIETVRNQDFDTFSDRCQMLRRYKNKYLLKDSHSREILFIEMLLSIEKSLFDKSVVTTSQQASLQILAENKENILMNDNEIVPYTVLWKIITKYLL